MPAPGPVFITDFDGTITRHDFYGLVVAHLLPDDVPDFWAAYRAGRMTHFDALNAYFAAARPDPDALLDLVDRMQPDPDLAAELDALRAAGWEVVVASAGCRWYIERILRESGVEPFPAVHANAGGPRDGRLVMERPAGSPYYCHEVGIDKAAIVRDQAASGRLVAFAGDGPPDLAPARLVPPEWRFARGQLADLLADSGEPFRPFSRWADVARALRASVPATSSPRPADIGPGPPPHGEG
jgi:2,3-diketo-5-methylthio-1-phosphopentane phosphatase